MVGDWTLKNFQQLVFSSILVIPARTSYQTLAFEE